MSPAIPSIVRHARTGLDLIINGALRQIESQFADVNSPEYKEATADLIASLHGELDDWEVQSV